MTDSVREAMGSDAVVAIVECMEALCANLSSEITLSVMPTLLATLVHLLAHRTAFPSLPLSLSLP